MKQVVYNKKEKDLKIHSIPIVPLNGRIYFEKVKYIPVNDSGIAKKEKKYIFVIIAKSSDCKLPFSVGDNIILSDNMAAINMTVGEGLNAIDVGVIHELDILGYIPLEEGVKITYLTAGAD